MGGGGQPQHAAPLSSHQIALTSAPIFRIFSPRRDAAQAPQCGCSVGVRGSTRSCRGRGGEKRHPLPRPLPEALPGLPRRRPAG